MGRFSKRLLLVPVVALWLLPGSALAWEQYSVDKDTGNCADCHGKFRDSPYVSLSDGQTWPQGLHDTHENDMVNGDCDTCHSSGPRFPVLLGSSAGGDGLVAYSCAGCHGREQDFGALSIAQQRELMRQQRQARRGLPRGSRENRGARRDGTGAAAILLQTAGFAAGLRQHHWRAGETICGDCHTDADPNNATPVGENVLPPYYANPGNGHPDFPSDACNPAPGFPENFAGTTLGLDNDGDLVYDEMDADCAVAVCGDGVIGPGEECDDSNTVDGDCCSAMCSFEASGSSCDDGLFCNAGETCDGAGNCGGGGPLDCGDGIGCTTDSCDETGDSCVNAPVDAACDDGMFCTGVESCDLALDCQAGTPVDCGDGVGCTSDSCDETGDTCVNVPDDATCNNGAFCDGTETCDPVLDCQVGPPVDCDDGVVCTVDSCDETGDTCLNVPDNASCANGVFCDGMEICDPALGCQAGPPETCDDSNICTDDTCNETMTLCENIFDPTNDPQCATGCGNGTLDTGEQCDDGNTMDGDCCSSTCTFEPAGSSCDDGLFCNVGETCNGAGTCGGGGPLACGDGVGCTLDSCDDVGDTCINAPDDVSCDNGAFCDGSEICNPVLDCQPGLPVDCDDAVGCTTDSCDESGDTCVNMPDDAPCDNGAFCDGFEICDPVLDCQVGTPVDCDDAVDCTVDSCDETADTCVNMQDDAFCDNGVFCDGGEVCDSVQDCRAGMPVDCDDGDICTDDTCNEAVTICDNVFDPGNDPTCQAQCPDLDGDGFSPVGAPCGPVDCDDDDPGINPGEVELCDDDTDNDCDGLLDAADDSCEFTGDVMVRSGPLQNAEYAGSETCADCHEGHFDRWRDTLHARMLIRPGDAQAAGFPLPPFNPSAGVEIQSWNDVQFVIGQKWKTRFVDRNGMVQGIQWNYRLGQWDSYNNAQLGGYDCGGCHTTGYDPNAIFLDGQGQPVGGITGSWVEYSIGCEACHGPGAEHASDPGKGNINRITFDWYDPDNDGVPDPVDVRSSVLCANCHFRGDREELQDDRRDHEEYNDWLFGPHASTMEPKSAEVRSNTISTYCAQCHSPGNADPDAEEHSFEYFEPSSATHVACISCHNPHQTSQPRWASLAFPPQGRQNPNNEQAVIARYRGNDGNSSTDDYDAFENEDSSSLCRDCHRIPGFRRHRDVRPPIEIVLNPPSNDGNSFTVPHMEHEDEGNAQCVDCHMHYSRTSINGGDIRSHTFLPNETLLDRNLWHFSDTCGQCHSEAQDCSWCHSEFGPAPGASLGWRITSGDRPAGTGLIPILVFGLVLFGGAIVLRIFVASRVPLQTR